MGGTIFFFNFIETIDDVVTVNDSLQEYVVYK